MASMGQKPNLSKPRKISKQKQEKNKRFKKLKAKQSDALNE